MLKTLQIKLLPDDNQKNILLSTFKKFNEACNFVSKIAWDNKIYNKISLVIYNASIFTELMEY